MANKSIINVVDSGNPSTTRRSVDLLPEYLRTDKNTKFLTSTIDQLIQPPIIERISGYIGSTVSPNYNPQTDNYIPAANQLEANYQLEPALVVRDPAQNVKKVVSYDDILNQIAFEKGNIDNHNRLFKSKTYAYDPQIDLDKFLNFPEYYWVPSGPDAVEITGPQLATVSAYTVTDDPTKQIFVFIPDGKTPDPLITLYRGMTYVFMVNSVHNFWIKTAISQGSQDAYNDNVSNNGTNFDQIVMVVGDQTPDVLYYVAGDDSTIAGQFIVRNLDANTALDVENEIIGKDSYTSGNGVKFTNGLKIRFNGNVTPAYYNDKEWVVEGVGTYITLTDWATLSVGGQPPTNLDVNFDAQGFDQYPFDDFTNIPLVPDYITINRSSLDVNAWSRGNRWVHKDVLAITAEANNTTLVLPDSKFRAKRPIIEFYAGIKLYNYGERFTAPIDVIDNITGSAFKTVEGQSGYYVDGELLQEGYRVIFNADEDSLVRGRIYKVAFVNINGVNVISLVPTNDNIPNAGDSVSVIRGTNSAGCNWWFDGSKWNFAQQKTKVNQPPLFDVFDENEISYSDSTYYNSTFKGTRIFGYQEGSGTPDPVLGFPLAYLNVTNVGDYLFTNFFNTDTFNIVEGNNIIKIWVKNNFLKLSGPIAIPGGLSQVGTLNTQGLISVSNPRWINTWVENAFVTIPIVQFQVVETATNNIEITAINNPGFSADISLNVFVNETYYRLATDYYLVAQGPQYFVYFVHALKVGDRVQFNISTAQPPNGNGFYEIALGASHNPLNGPIGQSTLAEITHSLKDIAVGPAFSLMGDFPGDSNLRDLGPVAQFGTRLISHGTPISFAQFFIGNKEHSLIDAVKKVSEHYQQFKLAFAKRAFELKGTYTPSEAVDAVMTALVSGKNSSFAYGYSDMVAFGSDAIERTYTVSDPRITNYSLPNGEFDISKLSERSVLIYQNGTQLIYGRDYTFTTTAPVVELLIPIKLGDVILVKDYDNTAGSYIPPTPTKLGLYPAYIPEIFIDDTYVTPTKVIQGHDGSITVAYNDYRDDVILELEKRIYNNLKIKYNKELLDINEIIPGAFRNNDYSLFEINNIIIPEFLKWAGFFGIDYQSNDTFDSQNPKTWNYSNGAASDIVSQLPLPGSWRAVFKWYYDTDRPHSHPWEMLGFSVQPSWWEEQYGPGPYTKGNLLLWQDLRDGIIRQGDRAGLDPLYARPNLLSIIPVDDNGNLLNLDAVNILGNINHSLLDQAWSFGNQGPAETAWRRSSLWPYVVQILLALTRPAVYSSYMFDTSRMVKNKADQYRYTVPLPTLTNRAIQLVAQDVEKFLSLSDLLLWNQLDDNGNRILASGYSVLLIEANSQRTYNYATELKTDLANINYNMFAKMGGFISKDKIRIIIDAVDPTSSNPGVLLPQEDYNIYFNQSNPSNTYSASGVIIQKSQDGFVVRGYDKYRPYFRINKPIRTNVDPTINVGGVSEYFVQWTAGEFYQKGMYVSYLGSYYITSLSHTAGNSFGGTQYFKALPALPTRGGVSVLGARTFESDVTIVPYGTVLPSIQAVYDLLVGYGKWLSSQGFVFDEVQLDLNQVMDWDFSGREFLYWTSQNWQIDSLITVSPFADSVKFNMTNGVVDDLNNPYYEYSIYKADGSPFSRKNYSISRQDGVFSIQTLNTKDGIFFIQFSTVQKEHAIILNNSSRFGDIIYQIETGYRQLRINVNGFRTADWKGDFFSPGFVYDNADIKDWQKWTDYQAGEVCGYNGKFYSTDRKLAGTSSFNFADWNLLPSKPIPRLYPNFDYKINQFEDFYSLDIDNFDAGQQRLAQHLTGYTPRVYLDNIFNDPIAQYKFYQGYIKEKGTKNAIDKLAKASIHNLRGEISYNETWAFRVGTYGGFNTKKEYEIALSDSKFYENPQLIEFVDSIPTIANDLVYYKTPYDLLVKPEGFVSLADAGQIFATTTATYNSSSIKMPTAGFVHYDDITATVYNKNSILDIANPGQLKDGDVLWLGFKEDGGWDVLRYSAMDAKAVSASLIIGSPNQFRFETDIPHYLKIGDIVSVTKFNTGLDAIYLVVDVPGPYSFVVNTTLTNIPTNTETLVGLLFRFVSSKLDSFKSIRYNPTLENSDIGSKVWVENYSGKWAVLEKVDNFTENVLANNVTKSGAHYGSFVYSSADDNTLIVSAPAYINTSLGLGSNVDVGRVYYYNTEVVRNTNNQIVTRLVSITSWQLNDDTTLYANSPLPAKFGTSVAYNSNDGIIVVGAPGASNVKLANKFGVAFSNGTLVGNGYNNCGLVKISNINSTTNFQNTLVVVGSTATNPTGSMFGQSILLQNQPGTKILLVGAPGEGAGAVYQYGISVANASVSTQTSVSMTATVATKLVHSYVGSAKFGYSISGSSTLTNVAVGVPGAGEIAIYTRNQNTFVSTQRLTTATINTYLNLGLNNSYGLGNKVVMSPDGHYLFATLNTIAGGAVVVSTLTNGTYIPSQIITSPHYVEGLIDFGYDIAVSPDSNTLVITAFGNAYNPNFSFDKYTQPLSGASSPYINDSASSLNPSPPTWDSGATKFVSTTTNSGSAYVYTQFEGYFAFGQQLSSKNVDNGSGYGNNVTITNDEIIVGAPTSVINSIDTGQIILFKGNDGTTNSWKVIREEDDLVDLNKVNRLITIDDLNQEIVDYLEFIDPIKGLIPGQADQELKFKSLFDPAVYSIGTTGVVVDTNTNWIDEHVGQLWWDLSSVKYMWYEQDTYEYRRNNWGNVFPGSTFNVYEWVGSEYLPSQWAALADTTEGLAKGISGQPRYADNSVMSVKQVYNSVSASFTNIYYFWVKNKTTVPNNSDRKMSAFEVASLISNPQGQGLQYAMILGPNALALVNYKPSLVADNIHLSIETDTIENSTKIHTEWLLIEEGNSESMPNPMLEQKLIDSILGHDAIGNPVPDPSLPSRLQTGINIRPRQSMFVNRHEAIRNVFGYANSILATTLIKGFRNFDNLTAKEEIPQITDGLYDTTVPDIATLDFIVTKFFVQAQVTINVNSNGNITGITILNPGVGYVQAPYIEISGDGTGAIIRTILDSQGQVVGADVISAGSGYTKADGYIRPYSVTVETDKNSNGNWAIYHWMAERQTWVKTRTQSYNTNNYWKPVDWHASTFDALQPIVTTVDSTYELDILNTLPAGNYVKVRNGGDGRFLILRKTATNSKVGTFDANWDLMASEHGTIQIDKSLWNTFNSVYAFDEISAFDQTAFDQTPDQELNYMLKGLKDDIFTGDLKVYWNTLFFKAVKYAFSEQKNLDWAFKTTFIGVTNHAGALDQRPTYKLQDSSYYESYINEIKPYHTKIRNFTVNYTATDYSNNLVTDFDLPSYWDQYQERFRTVGFGNGQLLSPPWNNWLTNYAYGIEEIIVSNGGSGYQFNPTVQIIPAYGDLGTGATAEAYISNGSVYRIIVTNPGKGYTATPTIVIAGGGGPSVVVATAYPILGNSPVRSMTTTIKFDRVGFSGEIGSKYFTDYYTADGTTFKYPLTWVPASDKGEITLTINGILQLSDTYKIVISESPFVTNTASSYIMTGPTGTVSRYQQSDTKYNKKFAQIVLTSVPAILSKIEITYPKDVAFFTAIDRIEKYYEPISGMPGKNQLGQLMAGIDFPGVKIDTLPYSFSGGYGVLPYWSTAWDNYTTPDNYGTVLNPQINSINNINLATNKLNSAITLQNSLNDQIVYVQNTLNTVPHYTTVATALGNQSVLNPYYTSLEAQIASLHEQAVAATATVVSLTSQLAELNSGNIAVTTPFVVATGTVINTYLNGDRIDGISYFREIEVSETEHSLGLNASFNVVITDTIPAAYSANISNAGTNYSINDVLRIFGDKLGGQRSSYTLQSSTSSFYNHYDANDLIITVTSTSTGGAIAGISVQGVPNTTRTIVGAGKAATVYIPSSYLLPSTTVTNFISKSGVSPCLVTLGIFTQTSVPTLGQWNVFGNSNNLYNGVFQATTATTSSITLSYTSDPGTFGTGITEISTSNNIVLFRSASDDGTLTPTDEDTLDTLISGGDFSGAILGINPADIVIDGDAYITANTSHAPEEMIPGEIQESVAISVFSTNPTTSSTQFLSAPMIKNYKYQLDGQTQSFNMGTIANTSSLIVVAGNTPLHFGSDYLLDLTNNNLALLRPLPGPDFLSISAFDLGGINCIDKQVIFNANRTIYVLSTVAYKDIGSIYVTVNGIPVPEFISTATNQTYGYTIEKAPARENDPNPRARLTIIKPGIIEGINDAALNKTQVWYFSAPVKSAGEIYTQVIPRAQGLTFNLEQPPGIAGPYSSQVIVELNSRRLIPPATIYFIVGSNQTSFRLVGSGTITTFNSTSTVVPTPPGAHIQWTIQDADGYAITQDINYPKGIIDNSKVEIWLNGEKLDKTPTNYFFNAAQGIVEFPTGRIKTGDALAFVIFDNYEYQIVGNQLLLQTLPYRGPNDSLRITSFTNHNGDFLRKEKFAGNSLNTYKIQRPVFDTAYIWVEYNGASLIADIDFSVSKDGTTITVKPSYYTGPTDSVVIISMSQNAYVGSLSYRTFTDILGRTSMKRIGERASTVLANPLLITDTTIRVEDGSKLSAPNPNKNLPGIIYIAGERIEYFTKFGNILGQLTRATLGTGSRTAYASGTKVIDQGPGVNIPISEKTIVQTFMSTNTNTTFVLNPADTAPDQLITFNASANPWDQVDVFYGGRKLLKPTTNTVVTYNPVAYDSNQQDSLGNLSSPIVLPEFTITNSLTTPTVQLNIEVQAGLELTVRQRTGQSMFKLSTFANPAKASATELRPGQEFIDNVKGFLIQDTAQLPDDTYYGGDPVIILETEFILQDENGNPIEGD